MSGGWRHCRAAVVRLRQPKVVPSQTAVDHPLRHLPGTPEALNIRQPHVRPRDVRKTTGCVGETC